MNATTVFEERKQDFLALLEGAQNVPARIEAAQLVLEQIACVLAQEEQDDTARQRQQAVMAALRRAPQMLYAAGAQGELVIAQAKKPEKPAKPLTGLRAIGAGVLALLALVELIDGRMLFALLQLAGGALVLFGGGLVPAQAAAAGAVKARGVLELDAKTLLEQIGNLCRAADVCESDLLLLEKAEGISRLSGTADEATIDLLLSMLEAKASGRADAAERTLDLAQQYLRMLGMEAVAYSADAAAYFDVLPTLAGERTIRPALLKDGKLLRRGVAAKAMERGVGA